MVIDKNTILVLIEILQSSSGIFLGVGFAVFTLVYAFAQNKKDYLKEVEELIRIEGISATILRKRNSSNKFISKMYKISSDAILLVIISSIGLVMSYILDILIVNEDTFVYILVGILIILIAMVLYIVKISIKLFFGYRK